VTTEEEAMEHITGCGALLHGHFVGTQEVPEHPGLKGFGRHMPVYLDGRIIVTHPDIVELLGEGIAQRLIGYGIEVVVGMPIGAYTLGHVVARHLRARYAMAEKAEGLVGVERTAFQNVVAGRRVALVEDTVSEGFTLGRGVAAVHACGGRLVAIGANFDRGIADPLDFGVPYLPLVRQALATVTLQECLASGQCSRGEAIDRRPGHGHDLEQRIREGHMPAGSRYSFR
jgi:orotate phosphoribosyltransferase